MTPLKLRIQGAIGIKAGLGRDELTMDIASLIPDDAVTVAIRGDNGMGKSTLMNLALSPWREPPMLAGSVYDHFGETGARELLWAHGGETYRTVIEYRAKGKTRTQKATLYRVTPAGEEPASLADNTVSDGKASTYDAVISGILGPQDIYYLSAFRAQGAPTIAEIDDPKALMRSLLALDEPAELADKAQAVRRGIKQALDAVRARTARYDGHEGAIAAALAMVDAESARASEIAAELATAQDQVALARAALDRALADDIDRQDLIQRRTEATRRIEEATARWNRAIAAADAAVTAAMGRRETAERDYTAAVARASASMDAARRKREAAESTLADAAVIRRAAADAMEVQAKLDAQAVTVADCESALTQAREIEATLRELEARRSSLIQLANAAAHQAADLARRAGYVEQVPCRGEGAYADCPALADAIKARDAMPTAESIRAAAVRDIEEFTADRDTAKAQAEAAPVSAAKNAMDGAVNAMAELRNTLTRVQAVAARAPMLAMAEAQKAEAEAEISGVNQHLHMIGAEHAARTAELDADKAATVTAASELREEAAHEISTLTYDRDRIPEPDSGAVVQSARERLQQATSVADAIARRKADAESSVIQHQATAGRLKAEIEEARDLIEQARALEDEAGYWELLRMGLRGVVDLSIEAAGPAIASTANRLLREAYGPRFSVRVVTQREQANGKTVETFDISVLDAASDTEASLIHKSGGETVWINHALIAAVGLHHQETAGVQYETLFADEAEDGLTEERKAMFYRMDRAALQLGGYRRKFFISHNPAAWEMADYVINMADWRVE